MVGNDLAALPDGHHCSGKDSAGSKDTQSYNSCHDYHHDNLANDSNGQFKGKGADSSTIVGPHARYLPGCSGGNPKEKQVVSNAMMQVYVRMRGPCMGGAEDPLFEWIRLREELPTRNPGPDHKKDVSRMLHLIDKALEETNMGGDSPRDAVFEIERPYVEHINVPEGMDISLHALTASCAEFEFDDNDSDDEEGNVPGGRISPCTFRAWSKGCTRWDDNATKPTLDTIRSTNPRQRPPTPEAPGTPRDHYPYYYNQFEDQCDEVDGEPMTPCYHVPTDPSIIYTPPGVDALDYQPPDFQAQYTRMAPLAAWDLRRHQFGGPAQDVQPSGEDERFTWQEIEHIATLPQPFGHLGLLRGADLRSYLSAQWAAVRTNSTAEASAQRARLAHEARAAALERDLALLRVAYLPALAERRSRARRARAAEHMVRHQAEAQAALNAGYYRLCRARAARDEGAARARELEREVGEACAAVGLRSPREVYDEVDRGVTGGPAWRERGAKRIEVPPTEV